MSALRPFGFFLILLVGLTACSVEASEAFKAGKSEQLPQVDKSKFKDFKGEGFQIKLLKEMSWNRTSGMTLLEADFLPKEYHLTIQAYPVAQFKKDPAFPKGSEKQLQWFAKTEGNGLKDKLEEATAQKMVETMVEKRRCFKQTIQGKEYGFPWQKTFFLRYYKTDNSLIKISAWTTSDNAKKYEKLAQYMGMTFKN